ncbi:hypothetical protein [Amaricoccus sp. W119]|uniref:hypothetical protein n=1 Tax=Amaricoccus sp. W119 TaxID=3391833 RepID=UPI0039A6C419
MDALVSRHLDAVEAAHDAERDARTSGKFKKLRRADPDAPPVRAPLATATSSRAPPRPAYKRHGRG